MKACSAASTGGAALPVEAGAGEAVDLRRIGGVGRAGKMRMCGCSGRAVTDAHATLDGRQVGMALQVEQVDIDGDDARRLLQSRIDGARVHRGAERPRLEGERARAAHRAPAPQRRRPHRRDRAGAWRG